MADVNCAFLSESKLDEMHYKQALVRCAGKLLKLCDAPSVLVTLDRDKKPVLLASSQPMVDPLDFANDEN